VDHDRSRLTTTGGNAVPDDPGEAAPPVELLIPLPAFTAATDISWFTVPQMAHMHNFATTRARLWDRLGDFAVRVSRSIAG
jgi:hypothetical protein